MMRWLACLLVFGVMFAPGCAPLAPGFYDAVPIDDWGLASCTWTRRYTPPVIYQESDFIRAFFEPVDSGAYRNAVPPPFTLPPRALVRVSVLHFYEMVNGPVYHESEVSVLVLHEGRPGWFVLTMPVTDGDACAGGRIALGTPKVMRRITLERGENRYVGTSYARGGAAPELTLTLDFDRPTAESAREVLRFVSPFPDYNLLNGRVVTLGGSRQSIEDLEATAPGIWKVRLGDARLDYPRDSGSLLYRLGVGPPLAAYWARMRYRYTITPS